MGATRTVVGRINTQHAPLTLPRCCPLGQIDPGSMPAAGTIELAVAPPEVVCTSQSCSTPAARSRAEKLRGCSARSPSPYRYH
ncbi:hypothetical protein KC329_g92 [Hortaea werneckii]|nr:hypothetical protein KC329_g92 [Hortaea werneckii]